MEELVIRAGTHAPGRAPGYAATRKVTAIRQVLADRIQRSVVIPEDSRPGPVSREPVSAILFDMDNTLFDLVEAQIRSCREVARFLGRDDGEELFGYFLRPDRGFEAHENILDYMADHNISDARNYSESCRLYEAAKLRHITPYDGVQPVLSAIRDAGYRMGIVTDSHSRDATRRMEKTGLLAFFDGMVTYDMVQVKKPSREPFQFALEMLRSEVSTTLIIGDSPRRDLEPCRGLGMRTVYARYGDRFSATRNYQDADFIIDSMAELPAILDLFPGPDR